MIKLLRSMATCAAAFAAVSATADVPADIHVSPEPGSVVTSIAEITVTAGWLEMHGSPVTLLINGRSCDATVTNPDYDTLVFTLTSPVNTDGDYLMAFPKGSFLMGWEGDENPYFEYSLKVEGGSGEPSEPGDDKIMDMIPQGYTVVPAAGAEIPVLSTISVTAVNDIFLSPKLKPGISINGAEVSTVHAVSGDLENTITWTLAKPINTPGHYNILIPEGAFFGYDETDSESFLFTVIVTGGDLPEPDYYPADVTAEPAAGSTVAELSRIAVMYPKLTSVFKGPEIEGISLSRGGEAVDVNLTVTPAEDTFNDPHIMYVDLSEPIVTPGEYALSFPAEAFVVSKYPVNRYSAPFSLTFNVSDEVAIEETEADASESAVWYTVDGIRIDAPATPGLYIRLSDGKAEKRIIR